MSDSYPPIVDCDLLEAAKENVQPLAAGRRVTALSSILATPHAQRDAKLSATRNRLRVNVQLALEEGDPLEAYCNLVNWTLESYPQGQNADSGLIELLEEATRVLKDHEDGRFRGDMRYLKLWTLYASFVDRPAIIFRFLVANEIGTNHALLYEEWANSLERNGKRKETDAAYLLGIARQAEPLDRLKARHREFQKRMMLAAATPESEEPSSAPVASARSRPALMATAGPSIMPSASTPSTVGNGVRMAVFVDVAPDALDLTGNAFPDIGTRKTRVKENRPETGKIAGTTIKQAGKTKRLASTSASKIVPFKDEPVASSSSSFKPFKDEPTTPSSVLKPFKDHPAVAPSTSFKPFRDESPTASPSFKPFTDEPMTPLTKFTPFKDTDDDRSHTPTEDISESVMQARETTEAEALRRDPLKNYVG